MDYLATCFIIVLALFALCPEGLKMASVADIQKMIDNMKRAGALTDRAATTAPKHAAIMDAFEHRMTLNDETMTKIGEYEKLMAAMDSMGNGGPPLVTTFSSDATGQTVGATDVMPIHRDTGDPVLK